MKKIKYEDITDSILKQAIPNNNPIPEIYKYKKFNLKNSKFDTKDITDVERETLKVIQNKIGGEFNIIHRVQVKGVRTPDAEYYNKLLHKYKRYYDVKAPKKSNGIKAKNNKISHAFDQAIGQTKNVIISLLRDDCDLSVDDANEQIIRCLKNKLYSWINIIILVGKNNYIRIYKRKQKRSDLDDRISFTSL